jgi:hypothetical protein
MGMLAAVQLRIFSSLDLTLREEHKLTVSQTRYREKHLMLSERE